jgi:hypothetical protein
VRSRAVVVDEPTYRHDDHIRPHHLAKRHRLSVLRRPSPPFGKIIAQILKEPGRQVVFEMLDAAHGYHHLKASLRQSTVNFGVDPVAQDSTNSSYFDSVSTALSRHAIAASL